MMGVDRPSSSCRWVRDRLPLHAGGELTGADRRNVERHLIGCPGCRERERSLSGALSVLQAAASRPLSGPDEAPSLWPALARQIREARHEPPSRFEGLFRFRPSLALAAVLFVAGLTAAWFEAPVRSTEAYKTSGVSVAGSPSSLDATDPEDFDANLAPPPPPIAPAVVILEPSPSGQTPKPIVRDDAPPLVPAERTASRFDYDLDHGTPMGPDAHDVKASY